MTIITSKTNKLVKKVKKLHQKKYRKTQYIIEGWHLYEEALANEAYIQSIFVTEESASRLSSQDNVVLVTEEILQDLADSKTPQGIVCLIEKPQLPSHFDLKGSYLILEDVQDPGNMGTMIRTADAAGFSGVFISDKSADLYSPKTLRSMQGSHFHLPVYRLPIAAIIDHFKRNHLSIYATTLSKDSIDYKAIKWPVNKGIVMGNEGQGISPYLKEQADTLVHIPMPGKAESLNVAVAAGIIMFSI